MSISFAAFLSSFASLPLSEMLFTLKYNFVHKPRSILQNSNSLKGSRAPNFRKRLSYAAKLRPSIVGNVCLLARVWCHTFCKSCLSSLVPSCHHIFLLKWFSDFKLNVIVSIETVLSQRPLIYYSGSNQRLYSCIVSYFAWKICSELKITARKQAKRKN